MALDGVFTLLGNQNKTAGELSPLLMELSGGCTPFAGENRTAYRLCLASMEFVYPPRERIEQYIDSINFSCTLSGVQKGRHLYGGRELFEIV